jgi:hypothetical protein
MDIMIRFPERRCAGFADPAALALAGATQLPY